MNKLSDDTINSLNFIKFDEITNNIISYKTDNITFKCNFPSVINNTELKTILNILNDVENRQKQFNETIKKKIHADYSVNMDFNININIQELLDKLNIKPNDDIKSNDDELQSTKQEAINKYNLEQIKKCEETKYILI
jgi:hypothetical protein